MANENDETPWVSFCLSTYKRPSLLKVQLESILQQSFKNFEIVISDNDPDRSGENIVKLIGDARLEYFNNVQNLGMIKSFNKSIERSRAAYVITITDDDPIVPDMLDVFYNLIKKHPGFGIYIGCSRTGKENENVEVFNNQEFLFQVLNPTLTKKMLWSSCIINKDILLSIGGIPDYKGLHLADHAMMALCGTINGGVIINKMFGAFTSHENNFSKGNIDLYFLACTQFYSLITGKVKKDLYIKNGENALVMHLQKWFIISMFSLRKHFTYANKQGLVVNKINIESRRIMTLNFMKSIKMRYYAKLIIFYFKKPLYVLNILH